MLLKSNFFEMFANNIYLVLLRCLSYIGWIFLKYDGETEVRLSTKSFNIKEQFEIINMFVLFQLICSELTEYVWSCL